VSDQDPGNDQRGDDKRGDDQRGDDKRGDDGDGPNPRRALVGLIAIVALIGAVLFIMHRLNQAAQIQDCVASGRTNCAPIDTGTR
jgi:hypothetical protein